MSATNPQDPTPENQDRLKTIVADALALPADARDAALVAACGSDTALLKEARSLLAAAERADGQGFLSSPTADVPSTADHPLSAATPITERPGTVIGPYKLLQQIGEGGFGTVFMAEQSRPIHRRVALKVVKLGMDTKAVIARFEAERQALAMMDHPNIARVLDAAATDTGRPYFVMELVKGEPITEYADRHKLDIDTRLKLFMQVCQAVQHAHLKGVIHRDLKPSNVLVSTQDGQPFAKVIDFGIAKATSSRLTEKTLFTEFHQFIGTPQYMSPEQADGNLDVDTRSDVYSLGVLLYELLTGQTPFDAKQMRAAAYDEIARMIREVEPPKPSTRLSTMQSSGGTGYQPVTGDPHGLVAHATQSLATLAASRATDSLKLVKQIRGELDWLVMKAMEKDRGRRYETPAGLAEDVGRYLEGSPVKAVPPSAGYRARKFVRKHRKAALASAAALALLVTGLSATTWQWSRAERFAKAESVERNRADVQRDSAELESYIANLALAQSAMDNDNWPEARERLNSCPLSKRGWEWQFLNLRAHSVDDARIPKRQLTLDPAAQLHVTQYLGPSGLPYEWELALPHGTPLVRGTGFCDGAFSAGTDGRAFVWVERTGRDAAWGYNQISVWSADGRLLGRTDPLITAQNIATHPIVEIDPTGHQFFLGDGIFGRTIAFDTEHFDSPLSIHAASDRTEVAIALNLAGVDEWPTQPSIPAFEAADMTVRLAPTGIEVARDGRKGTITLVGRTCTCLTVSPDRSRIVGGLSDGTVKIWDATSCRELLSANAGPSAIESCLFSRDGTRLLLSAADSRVEIWDARPYERRQADRNRVFNERKPAAEYVQKLLATETATGNLGNVLKADASLRGLGKQVALDQLDQAIMQIQRAATQRFGTVKEAGFGARERMRSLLDADPTSRTKVEALNILKTYAPSAEELDAYLWSIVRDPAIARGNLDVARELIESIESRTGGRVSPRVHGMFALRAGDLKQATNVFMDLTDAKPGVAADRVDVLCFAITAAKYGWREDAQNLLKAAMSCPTHAGWYDAELLEAEAIALIDPASTQPTTTPTTQP